MSVHMFRVFIGPNESKMTFQQAKSSIQDWVDSNKERAEDSVSHELRDVFVDGYWLVNVRFQESETKENLIQKFEDKIKKKCDWYRMGYHICPHDDNNESCSWDDQVDWTAKGENIPDDIPTFI